MAASKTFKIWKVEDDNLLRSVMKENLSCENLREKYFSDRTLSSLRNRMRRLGLKHDYKLRKNFFDESFWDVPNLLNSFWAGTMAADGNISEQNGALQSLNWEISIVDEKYLDKFIKDCKFTGDKQYRRKNNDSGSFTDTVKIRINSKKWLKTLTENFKVTPRKASRVSVPENLSEDLKMAWLVGYINGDGCIFLDKENDQNNKNKKLSIAFTSASFEIIKWINDFTNYKFISKKKRLRNVNVRHGVNTYYNTSVGGQPAIQMFIYLSQFDVPILERKWRDEKILNFVKEKYLESPDSYNSYIWNKDSFIVNFLNNDSAQ